MPLDFMSQEPILDIVGLLNRHAGRNYELQAEHVNPANVRALRTIGFDRCYVRAEGPYLWDVKGEKYLSCFRATACLVSAAIIPRFVACWLIF